MLKQIINKIGAKIAEPEIQAQKARGLRYDIKRVGLKIDRMAAGIDKVKKIKTSDGYMKLQEQPKTSIPFPLPIEKTVPPLKKEIKLKPKLKILA